MGPAHLELGDSSSAGPSIQQLESQFQVEGGYSNSI
jgi:hypothetical protein